MNNQAKIKLEKIKKLKLPEKVRATADKIEKGLSSADAATQKKAEDALNKLYDQIKAVAAKQREEKTEKEVNEKTIVPQNADIAAPEAKKELTKKTTVADDVIDKALKNDPELSGFGKSDKRRDAGRKALPAGRRVAQKGWANQFGKSDGGRVYYENRENRKDRKSPAYKAGYPFLAKGGKIHPMDEEDGMFYVNLYKTKGDQIISVDEREYNSKASAMTYAMMKRDFMKVGESIFVMNDDGDVLYTSIGTKKMAMGGKFPYQNAQVGDNARVILDNKMGTIMVTYGRRFHLKFPDGSEKTYSAEELEFFPTDEMMNDGGMMANGGNIENPTFVVKNLDGKIVLKTKSLNKASDYHGLVGRDTHTVETLDGRILSGSGDDMADGGVIGNGKNGYVAFYKGKKVDVNADTMYGAQKTAAKYFNAKKEYDVNVVLAEIDGKQYVQSTVFAKGGDIGEELLGGHSNAQLKPSGYKLISQKGREIIVSDDGGETKERYVKNNGFSGYRLVYKGNDYEFTDSFEDGGMMADGGLTKTKTGAIKLYYHQTSGGAEYLCSSKVKGTKDEGSFDSEYIVRIDGAKDFGGELLPKSVKLYYHQTSGGAEYLCSSKKKGTKDEGSFDSEYIVRIDGAKDFGGELLTKVLPYAKGGYMAEGENYEYVNTFKRFDSNVPVPQDDFEKLVDAYHKQLSGDKLAVSKYKVLKLQMGNYLGHKTVEEMEAYIEKTHNAHKMAKGGYVSKRDIEAITIVNPNKSNPKKNYLTFRSGEFLNGLNQFAKGGKLTDNYTYIKRSDIFAVYYKDKAKKYNSIMESKPKNGFWVSKKALIREGGKTPSKSSATFDAYKSYDELSKLNGKIWDKLKIESGSQIYASDSLQKKLAIEYPNSGIDSKFKSLTAAQRKKVAEVMTDENEHSFRNYLTLRGYLGPKEYDSYERIFDPKSRYVLNPANFKNYTADKVKIGSILTTDTGVKVKVVEYNPQFGVKVIRTDKYAADKPSQYLKLKEFQGFEKMADGGSIGFEALSKKVASRYAGKNVKPKYQGEYGKTYDKAEAKEVGDKVAAKVYRMQQGKMAMGGKMQGYNDRLDESLAERNDKIAKMNATFKARRNESKGENKALGKRAYSSVSTMDKMASGGKIELPHQLDKYFTKPAGTIEVEMSKLIPIRARKSGIENAEVYMKKAYDGEMSKRKPIEIYKTRNKKYRVNDGNSTYAVAKKNGWETIYATVVSNPNVTKRAEKSTFTIAKEIRKVGESWADAVKRVKENRK